MNLLFGREAKTLELSGEHLIDANREQVWKLLNDPETLKKCIPGCQTLEQNEPDTFNATVVLKIGPVKATFDGEVELSEKNYPESYVISGKGSGGVAGLASGSARVILVDEEGKTRLKYEADAAMSGKIAQLGSRLIKSTSAKLASKFFSAFCETVTEHEVAQV